MCCTVSYIDVSKLTLNNVLKKSKRKKNDSNNNISLFTIHSIGKSSLLDQGGIIIFP